MNADESATLGALAMMQSIELGGPKKKDTFPRLEVPENWVPDR